MGESLIVRRGGKGSEETAAPTITIISESPTGVTFTLKNNDDNTALITFEIDDQIGGVELAAAAISSNITVALAVGTYTLSAFATVVGEVATQSTSAVEIVSIPAYEELFSTTVATATTQIDITGLSIGKADTLRLVWTHKHNVIGNFFLRLFPNDNTTATNYHSQELKGITSNLTASRQNEMRLSLASSSEQATGFADIKISNNDRFVCQSQYVERIGSESSSVRNSNANNIGTFSITSITKLSIVASATNTIGVGSKFQLYKVTEAA